MTTFARAFRVTYVRLVSSEVMHGVQFPDGRCVVALPYGGFDVSTAFEHLPLPDDAEIEWQDGGEA